MSFLRLQDLVFISPMKTQSEKDHLIPFLKKHFSLKSIEKVFKLLIELHLRDQVLTTSPNGNHLVTVFQEQEHYVDQFPPSIKLGLEITNAHLNKMQNT